MLIFKPAIINFLLYLQIQKPQISHFDQIFQLPSCINSYTYYLQFFDDLKRSSFCLLQVPQSELDSDTVKTILSEYKIHNADVTLKYDATSDDLIDVVEGNRIYIPCIYILNKIGEYGTKFINMLFF